MKAEKPLLMKVSRGENPHLYTREKKLILWLDAANGTQSYARVMRIRYSLLRICQNYIAAGLPCASSIREDPLPDKSVGKIMSGLNSLLERYVMYLRLSETETTLRSNSRVTVKWIRSVLSSSLSPDEFRIEYKQKTVATEGDIVRTLLSLAEEAQLYKLRTCDQCKTAWLFAHRAIDRFCSSSCRIQDRLKSESSKERQRLNQRRYREGLKRKMVSEMNVISRP